MPTILTLLTLAAAYQVLWSRVAKEEGWNTLALMRRVMPLSTPTLTLTLTLTPTLTLTLTLTLILTLTLNLTLTLTLTRRVLPLSTLFMTSLVPLVDPPGLTSYEYTPRACAVLALR